MTHLSCFFRRIACLPIRLYQWVLSPLLGTHCRFVPSCSHYAHEAVMRHGICRGCLFTLRRLLRCHPFASAGFDPVPPRK